MSTFTRLSDSAILNPIIVFGPYVNDMDAQTVTHRLAESSEVRVTYRPVSKRTGSFGLLFSSYEAAYDASLWFGSRTPYDFDGPPLSPGYIIEDGYIVWSDGGVDASYAFTFVVSGQIQITQNEQWELAVPFVEVTP